MADPLQAPAGVEGGGLLRRGGALLLTVMLRGRAAIGPIGSAAAQFVLSLVLLHALSPAMFGSFSMLLVASQLGTGVWSALFCAAMPMLLAQGGPEQRQATRDCLMSASLVLTLAASLVFMGLALALGVPPTQSLMFAAYAGVMLLRWFARAYAYSIEQPLRTMASDIAYSAVLAIGVAVVAFKRDADLMLPYAVLLVSAVAGLAPFGLTYLKAQFLGFSPRAALAYRDVWREHSRWSLVGVVTTEATANAHAYIVTLFAGPAAFATVAASALPMRPISVVSNALSEFERAQMARQLVGNRRDAAVRSLKLFHLILAATWIGTVAAGVLLTRYAPDLLMPPEYDRASLAIGLALWLAIALVRLLRTPESTLLQAAGQFRPLANASIMSCGVSVVGVGVLLALGGPLWSLVGVLLGEMVFAFWIWRQKRLWLNSNLGNGQ